MKSTLFVFLFLLSTASFAQNPDDELWKTLRMKEAQGLDSLLGMRKDSAMAILTKYHPFTLGGYFYKSAILKIENFNKWQHLASLYIFIDSNDLVCKLNYYFNNEMPEKTAEALEDSMRWAVPSRIHKTDKDYGHSRIPVNSLWNGFVLQDDDYSEVRRLFYEQQKPKVKVIYSVAKLNQVFINPCTGKVFYNDLYEPREFDPNMQLGDSTLRH
jgi:hypothetical protein